MYSYFFPNIHNYLHVTDIKIYDGIIMTKTPNIKSSLLVKTAWVMSIVRRALPDQKKADVLTIITTDKKKKSMATSSGRKVEKS